MASIAATYRPESAIESESDFRLTTVFEEGGKHFRYYGLADWWRRSVRSWRRGWHSSRSSTLGRLHADSLRVGLY